MYLLLLLQIKHFLVDWVFQTDYQINHKGHYLHPGGLIHSLQHAVLTAVAVSVFNPGQCLVAGLLDGLAHYHIDWAKQNLSKGLSLSDKRFWILMGADQLAHQLTYLAILCLIV